MSTASLYIDLKGNVLAKRDAQIQLTHVATGRKLAPRTVGPKGSLRLDGLKPGEWELELLHPNLISALLRRRIRIFDQPEPTRVPLIIPKDLFSDVEFDQDEVADLRPVAEKAEEVELRLEPLETKAAGELIKASDWNTLVGTVRTLAVAVSELVQLVSPHNHDHEDIEEVINGILKDLRTFSEAYGQSILELQRQIELAALRNQIEEALDEGEATPAEREFLLGRFQELERYLNASPELYTQKLSRVGDQILTLLNALALRRGDEGRGFLLKEVVKTVYVKAGVFSEAKRARSKADELSLYTRTNATEGGGSKVAAATRVRG